MYRSRVSSFYHAQLLTGGNPIGFSALAARLNDSFPANAEVVCTTDGSELMAQVQHSPGERSARLVFIAPDPKSDNPALLPLLEYLCVCAGEMGAVNLLAEVREADQTIETFRRGGFSIYGWETIWRLPSQPSETETEEITGWRLATSKDESSVRSLYHTLVPPLVQTAEPYRANVPGRMVYLQNGEMLAFVESLIGSKGIYITPVIHPSLKDPGGMLAELHELFSSTGKPVYLQMRSYQAWLTSFLEQMEASVTVHFALMSHRLAIAQYAAVEQNGLVVNNRHAETTAPIVQKTSRIGQ
jgi:hypothetical protein